VDWLSALQSPRHEGASRHKLRPADALGLWAVVERERAALSRGAVQAVGGILCLPILGGLHHQHSRI
jgi:hypothetical protein